MTVSHSPVMGLGTGANLPPRLDQPEVLRLARYSRATLKARQAAGRMPQPIDRGKRGGIYDRDAVLKALGLAQDEQIEQRDPWMVDPSAINDRLSRPLRRPQAAR